jgi:hypothetical protein
MEHVIIDKKWCDLIKIIQPLDLVLFSGNDIISSTIKTLQNKKLNIGAFSHVGVIVNSEILPHIKEIQKNEWYIWESTSSLRLPGFENEVPDIFGDHKIGVQIRNLKKVLDIYNGNIYIGKLKDNPTHCFGYQIYTSSSNNQSISHKVEESDKITSNEMEINPWIHLTESLKEIEDMIEQIDKMYKKNNQTENVQMNYPFSSDLSKNKTLDISNNFIPPIRNDSLINDQTYNHSSEMSKIKNDKEYKKIITEIRYIYEIYGNRIYNASILDLLSALYPILRPFRNLKYKIFRKLSRLFRNKKILPQAVFCSQFVAIIYSRFGIIDRKINYKNFVPVDFLGCDEDGQKNIISTIFKIVH